ncbi:M48 family metallopeptidase [Desulfoprunum benzoelyticum]|uniref:STE24 endopeptidase n=1 Tax=Desulfoprunum benzoelyticum TaxID=1506996 RepID=A0A840UXS1_9BACT|nr:M48 family metallopeptidase [Desulfoprunum benzoelyticum]MBB5349733.1 STE24 endopeptidase [Desulfoprunum benzoelyticum]MBM9531847.1 M48 family metallopeptidase [Desulfoprunum benzoelyticum]
MNTYLVIIASILLLSYLLHLAAALLNLRALSPELPAEFVHVYHADAYSRSQHYTRATTVFSLTRATIVLVVTLTFIVAGGFNLIDGVARGFGLSVIPTGLIFLGLLALLQALLHLPFAVYATFGIEQRFGFNTTTVATFITDGLKAALLTVVLGGPLLAGILWLFETSGPHAWLYCWLAAVVFILVVQFLAPVLIMPLFNRFTPLAEGELKEAITGYAAGQRFALQGIYTMDGSRRSTRANAFFTGFGRFRRIVFFDTLMQQLTTAEIVAVLAHEMGHYRLRHIMSMMALSILQTGLMFFLLSFFLYNPGLFAAFGMEHISVHAGLVFFGFLYAPISTFLGIGMNAFSRHNEYQADRFAARTGADGEALISGLKKLSVSNLANLTPHPFHVFVHYSHPPILARIAALRKVCGGSREI